MSLYFRTLLKLSPSGSAGTLGWAARVGRTRALAQKRAYILFFF